MAIRQVVIARVQPNTGDEYASAFQQMQLEVRHEPGCEEYALYRSIEDPDKFVLLERWTDADAHSAHHTAQHAPRPHLALRLPDRVIERYEV